MSISEPGRGTIVVIALLLAGLVAAPLRAHAEVSGSIVFIRDHDVWITPADDPDAARPLTTDGSAERPYSVPVMDSFGNVYAVASLGDGIAGSGDIVRLNRSGDFVGEPFRPVTTGLIYSLDVSPDGETLAFTWAQSSTSGPIFGVAAFAGFASSDGSTSDLPTALEGYQPVFYADDRAVMVTYSDHYSTQGLSTYQLGQASAQPWLLTCQQVAESCVFPTDPDVSDAVNRLVVTSPPTDDLGSGNTRLVVWDLPGNPPSQPTYACDYVATDELFEPSWSPDGDALVWEEGDGVHIAEGFDSGCEHAFGQARLLLPGATWPSWSSAAATGGTPPGTDRDVAPAPDRTAGVTRFAGADRFTTAAAVSRGSFPGTANDVFIVTGTNWPDALAAGPAAAVVNGPVLPVLTDGIPSAIMGEIQRLEPRRAWLIGGAGVVGDGVADALRARGIDVTRVSGDDRYSTAAAVADRFFPDADGAYYASGFGYADALGGGAAAARRGWPLLLTARDSLPSTTPVVGSERIVLGGAAAVSESVADRLGARRVAGADRYATAAAIARDAFSTTEVGYLATGLNFPDALAGAPAAARDGAPLLLAPRDCVTAVTRDAFIALGITSRVVLGGTAAVSGAAADLRTC